MGFRTNNLNSFFINKDDNQQDNDLIAMWHELDQDFSENSEDTNFNVLEAMGYKSLAEQEIKQKDWIADGHDDLSKIERVLNWIKQGHGSYSSQFQYLVTECGEGYTVAVSYLT